MMKDVSKTEEEVLHFWQKNKIFEKSVSKKALKGDYVFYDGPPFATGTPHYGHIVASLMKDVVPRYWTMQGYKVERRWGWDCHGLPIENIIEEEFDIKNKKDIEEKIGVEKFNELCQSKVLMYADEWKKFIPRMGRWVDMENSYKTMDLNYMESIWWVFKQLWEKGLVYEGHKSMHICPRCQTTLSQSEVSEGYKEVQDLSLVAKFEILNSKSETKSKIQNPKSKIFILAWTTTAWTLPGNVALAVGKNIDYVKIALKRDGPSRGTVPPKEYFILAKSTAEKILEGYEYEILEELKGKDLVGKSYKPLFPYFDNSQNRKKGFKIYAADFVSIEEGTGIVHIAPAFGEDDLNLGKKEGLPFIQHVDFSGCFTQEVADFAGELVRPTDNPQAIDQKVIVWLENQGKLFKQEKYTHSYPHCWRCDAPLLNYATSSWFVKVTAIKDKMIELAKKINWVPAHLKQGRFGKWLEGAEDWSISRQRFWGSVLPIWRCQMGADLRGQRRGLTRTNCGNLKVIGSIKELEELSGQKVSDLHKHIVDKITFKCEKCKGEMQRIPDVLDCWFESSSMPYAQMHYPFENKEKFEKIFPAEFIAEGVDQCRCWFYYLLVLSTALFDEIPFKNVIANGIVLAEDGEKMSKRKKNYPDPNKVVDQYGADALRYYLLTSPVMKAENLCFSKKAIGVEEVYKKLILILYNVFEFYKIYRSQNTPLTTPKDAKHILDRWILAKLNLLIKTVTEQMNVYDLVEASRPIVGFVNDLSTWWLRRSRERFKSNDPSISHTTRYILHNLSKLIAPFTPFIAEKIYLELHGPSESVHLEKWPEYDETLIDKKVLGQMDLVRKICEVGLKARAEVGIKIRQPLASYSTSLAKELDLDYVKIIKEELNVLDLKFGEDKLDIELTDELKAQGVVREIVRSVNALRKEAGLTIADRIVACFQTPDQELQAVIEKFREKIKKEVLANEIVWDKLEGKWRKEIKINNTKIEIGF